MKFYYIEWDEGGRTAIFYSNKSSARMDMLRTDMKGTVKSVKMLPRTEAGIVWTRHKHFNYSGYVYQRRAISAMLSIEFKRIVNRSGQLRKRMTKSVYDYRKR